jgi:exopolyphosphatase/guanosine-5'-triphosphate,3'-diphosphate pyrophosphatase
MNQQKQNEVLAAIDLGSNSFHMIIAKLHEDGHFQVIDKMREMVQLRAGIDTDGNISEDVQARALDCLERFGQRIRDFSRENVRIVGTNTLRVAQNSRQFLLKAQFALGHQVEVITGEEEARLIYLGVSHALAFDKQRRLVMDIGGGSTEYIIGEGLKGLQRESLGMGCVSFTKAYFPEGDLSETNMRKALIAASSLLREIRRPYRNMGWEEAIGASGTIRCIANIVKTNGWADNGVITDDALDKLIEQIVAAGHIDKLKIDGLTKERASVIAGGAAVLKASFERLKIDKMTVSDGALREGLLYDMLGRRQHDDQRDHTVAALIRRYHVDTPHAQRVADMCEQLFEQVATDWELDENIDLPLLLWAAKLHEIGLVISHSQFHKHSSYMVANSDLLGFSREEQHVLSVIVRGQRRSFPEKYIAKLPEEWQQRTRKLTMLLRLAMVFNRGRSEKADTYVKLKVAKHGLKVGLPDDWLSRHRLTETDLHQERDYLKAIDINLSLN